jgi:hypothetical protein
MSEVVRIEIRETTEELTTLMKKRKMFCATKNYKFFIGLKPKR